jgi:hypothetical protein
MFLAGTFHRNKTFPSLSQACRSETGAGIVLPGVTGAAFMPQPPKNKERRSSKENVKALLMGGLDESEKKNFEKSATAFLLQ